MQSSRTVLLPSETSMLRLVRTLLSSSLLSTAPTTTRTLFPAAKITLPRDCISHRGQTAVLRCSSWRCRCCGGGPRPCLTPLSASIALISRTEICLSRSGPLPARAHTTYGLKEVFIFYMSMMFHLTTTSSRHSLYSPGGVLYWLRISH